MASRKLRVLLDTSVIIAGILSPEGGSGALLDACRLKLVDLYLSKGIIKEASNKFLQKFPDLHNLFLEVIEALHPIIITNPTRSEISRFLSVIEPGDAPILAAGAKAPIDYLVTLDKKDFMTQKIQKEVLFRVVTPGEFLNEFKGE